MVSKKRAVFNTAALLSFLFFGLLYSVLFSPALPDSIVIPTAGGGLMNFGFWVFYSSTIGSIPELRKSFIAKSRDMFLLSGALHFAAVFILLVYDVSWIVELFRF